ncbi:MAG: 5-(carboxyamino)imidazole ribonucleotide mutase [Elusimicrobiota bacterium]
MKQKISVSIIAGSSSDLPHIEKTQELLRYFGISYDVTVASAHRTPDKVERFIRTLKKRGTEVVIACAGMAAHLPAAIASRTVIPVIGVPMETSHLAGMDSLLSIVQMPQGVPVACMTIGSHGSVNAAIFAAEILSLKYPGLRRKLFVYKKRMRSSYSSLRSEKLKVKG